MNKKAIGFIMTGLMAVGVGMAAQQPQAHAAGYKWVKTKNYKNIPWHNKSNKTAYMYNWNHTKKLHNLKNYPHTTWYVSKSIKMVKGNKSGVFYKVTSGNKKVSGYVYRGYLVKGKYQVKTVAEPSYKDTILDTFKGTIYDKGTSDFLADGAGQGNLEDPRTPEQKANTITIRNTTTLDDYNPEIHKLRTHQITFKQFLDNDLKKQDVNPNNYSGYNIAINAYVDGDPSETSDVGLYVIMLYK
ncbi:hypothetical protein [Lentilactobacillus senioris]|uniref:hypothetical protein n=1 Tax=Lentilactobacillus senioris TaxID=931534 RepID=UPI003D298290